MTFRALLVDDDQRSMAELAPLFDGGRLGFEVTLAGSEEEAVAAMASGDFDCLIAGIGDATSYAAKTLSHASVHHKHIGRLAIGTNARLAGAPTTHYLHRPLDGEKLRRSVLAAALLGDRISSERLDSILSGALRMPALPTVYLKLQEVLRGKDPSIKEIGEIIRSDPAVSVKVIQTVNSALYGLRTAVSDVSHAAILLGIEMVTHLVLAVAVFNQASSLDIKLIESMWQDALGVSALAGAIAKTEGFNHTDLESTKLGGLLHDIGAIVLFQNWRDDYLSIEPTDDAEKALFGVGHSDIGGYLCALWRLPRAVVDTVLNHHHPVETDRLTPTAVVHIARSLVSSNLDIDKAAFSPDLDEAIITRAKLEKWVALVG